MSDRKKEIIKRLRNGTIDVKRELLGINLENEDLQGLNFEEAIMMGSSFSRSNLTGAKFMSAALMGADFSKAILIEADLRSISGMGAHFDEADLSKADLRYAALMGGFFRGAICNEADFRVAVLSSAKLERANMTKSKLEDAILREAILTDVTLVNATVKNTDFTRADLHGTDLRGIKFDDRTLRTVVDSYNWDKAKWDEETKATAIKLFDKIEVKRPLEIPKDTSPHKLFLKCRTCGVEFEAGIITNPRSFATSVYRGNIHECPNGHRHAYDKEDYILKKLDNLL